MRGLAVDVDCSFAAEDADDLVVGVAVIRRAVESQDALFELVATALRSEKRRLSRLGCPPHGGQSTCVNLPKAASIDHPIRRCAQPAGERGVLSWVTPKEGTENGQKGWFDRDGRSCGSARDRAVSRRASSKGRSGVGA